MNYLFEPGEFFPVPDGTEVSPFLNATDVNQTDLPWGILGEMSIASGKIGPRVHSWIHVHPAVTQVTYLLAGSLEIFMLEAAAERPYRLQLESGQAVVSEPGTLFQLQNNTDTDAQVLYIVSPSYVFEKDGDRIIYDDSIMVARSWKELAVKGYDVPALQLSSTAQSARRTEALSRLTQRKG